MARYLTHSTRHGRENSDQDTVADRHSISLHLPTRQSAKTHSVETRPKIIEKWLEQLPRANTGECARLYFGLLRDLNRIEIADHDRFKILEMCLEPGEFIYQALIKHYLGLPFPLSVKKQQVAVLARELECELALGYKIIVEDRINGKTSKIDRHTFHVALHRCCEHLGNVLLRSYMVYMQTPPHIWAQLNRLYHYAETHKLHLGELRDTGSSIEQIYKRILLLKAINPNRMRQSDIVKTNTLLLDWVKYAMIVPVTNAAAQDGLYCVDLTQDAPPDYFVNNSTANLPALRLIDTGKMLQHIHDTADHYTRLSSAVDTVAFGALSPHTLHQLLVTWSGGSKRHFTRSHGQNNVEVLIGLTTVHHFLMEGELTADLKKQGAKDVFRPTESGIFEVRSRYKSGTAGSANIDIWNPSYTIASQEQDYNIDFDSPAVVGSYRAQSEAAQGTKNYEVHICASVDESATGYRLVWIPWEGKKPPLNVHVGDLVAVRNMVIAGINHWSIGVIRWIKNSANEKLEMGVEKLGPYGMAAGVRSKLKGKETGDIQRAIILPAIKALRQPETLVVPSLIDATRSLKLYYHGKDTPIKLSAIIDSTGSITQYEFKEVISGKVEPGHDDNQSDSPLEKFNNIWKSL